MQAVDKERAVLEAVGELATPEVFADDKSIAEKTGLDVLVVRAFLDRLERKGLTDSANSIEGHGAMLTGEGRIALSE